MKQVKKTPRRTKTPAMPTEITTGTRGVIEIDILRELAAATTAYHEAPPERFEEARVLYEEALQRFRLAQSETTPRTMTAGAGSHFQVRE